MSAASRSLLMRGVALAGAVALGACASSPEPAYTGDPAEGHAVARNLCSSCHAIEPIGASPNPGAPPFRHLLAHRDAAGLTRDLDNYVSISHLRMPTFYLGEHHPEDLVAYIRSIKSPEAGER